VLTVDDTSISFLSIIFIFLINSKIILCSCIWMVFCSRKKANICIFINSDHRKMEKLNLEPIMQRAYNNVTTSFFLSKKNILLVQQKKGKSRESNTHIFFHIGKVFCIYPIMFTSTRYRCCYEDTGKLRQNHMYIMLVKQPIFRCDPHAQR